MEFGLFAIFFICGIVNFLIFDSVLRTQYKRHHDQWISDGMPHGFFFFHPKETRSGIFMVKPSSWLAMQGRYLSLIFFTPEWIELEPHLKSRIFIYRLLHLVGLVAWLGIAISISRK